MFHFLIYLFAFLFLVILVLTILFLAYAPFRNQVKATETEIAGDLGDAEKEKSQLQADVAGIEKKL